MNAPPPRSKNVSGELFLFVLGLPFLVLMIASIWAIDTVFGVTTLWVVLAALGLGTASAGWLAFAQRRAAAMALLPLWSVGWFVVILLVLFLLAGEFNRYGRPEDQSSLTPTAPVLTVGGGSSSAVPPRRC